MPASWWTDAENVAGNYGRVALDSGPAEVACDWIAYDHGAQTGFVRIFRSGASTGSETFRIYPPKSANGAVAAGDTYGQYAAYDSDWKAYWTLQSDANDRTVNARHLTAYGSPTAGDATGKFGNATDFDGTQRFSYNADLLGGSSEPETIIAWHRTRSTATGGTRRLVASNGSTSSYIEHDILWYESGGVGRNVAANPNDGPDPAANESIKTGAIRDTWCQIVGTFENDSTVAFNAGSPGTANTTATTAPTQNKFSIGMRARTNNYGYDGLIHDVQVHSVARSSAWISTEYSQTNDNATFWGTWTWNAGGATTNRRRRFLISCAQ